MSASREKKTRQEATAQGSTEREQKKQLEEKQARRSRTVYTVVGAVCAVLVVFLLVWSTGVIQRNATAVTANGVKYTAADVQYYYRYYATMYGLGTGSSSMYDILVETAVDALASDAAVAAKAQAEGYVMSEEYQGYLDDQIAQLDTVWQEYGYSSQKAYLRALYGPYMTYDKLVAALNRQYLAADYSLAFYDTLEYDETDYQTYYTENADDLDTFTITQYVLQARVDTTDSEGNAIEMTDEEKEAAYEAVKAETKATAEKLQARLEAGEDPEALAGEYSDELYSYDISEAILGSSLNSVYTDWAYDSARRSGDTTLAEYESPSAYTYNYYVARFEGRELDAEALSVTVRHILVAAETGEGASEPTEAQYEAAKIKAEELLSMWKAGDATEDSFASLATANSADTGSAANGGLISGITASSTYVDTFKDWALDPTHEAGDTGIVQNTGSSVKGWHVMYYVSGEPVWRQTVYSALSQEDFNAWLEEAQEGYEANTGLGLKFVQA